MTIQRLTLQAFRALPHGELDCHPQVNLFSGANGAGKTSILEAIYYLVYGKSFRTHLGLPVLAHGQQEMMLAVDFTSNGRLHRLGLLKGPQETCFRHNGENVRKRSEVVSLLPAQFFDATTYRHFISGPKYRRSFLDWGVFHVKPAFAAHVSQYRRALMQRNLLLKQRAPQHEVRAWDEPLVEAALIMDADRRDFFQPLSEHFLAYWQKLGHADEELSFHYDRGWPQDQDLLITLQQDFQQDSRVGYTRSGPHRADLKLCTHQRSAFDWLSQGQLKIMAYALYLAQLHVMDTGEIHSVFLLDDLPSELDNERQNLLVEALFGLNCQLFITGISYDSLAERLREQAHRHFSVSRTGIASQVCE